MTAPQVAPKQAPARPARAPRPAPVHEGVAARLRSTVSRTADRPARNLVGTVLLSLLFVAVFGIVVFQALLIQTQARLDDLDEKIVVEQQRSDALRVDLAERQSPERIVTVARDRLGMIDPAEVLYLENDLTDDAAAVLEPAPPTGDPTSDGEGRG